MHRSLAHLWMILGLAAPLVGLGHNAVAQEAPPGRYHIVQAGTVAMMVDTVTGRSWRLITQNNVTVWDPLEYWAPFKPIHLPPAPGAPGGGPGQTNLPPGPRR
jgi:hypothetical protein